MVIFVFSLEKQKKEKFCVMNRYFSVMRFEGEQNLPPEDDHLFSNQDYRMFLSYIRGTIIEVSYECLLVILFKNYF